MTLINEPEVREDEPVEAITTGALAADDAKRLGATDAPPPPSQGDDEHVGPPLRTFARQAPRHCRRQPPAS